MGWTIWWPSSRGQMRWGHQVRSDGLRSSVLLPCGVLKGAVCRVTCCPNPAILLMCIRCLDIAHPFICILSTLHIDPFVSCQYCAAPTLISLHRVTYSVTLSLHLLRSSERVVISLQRSTSQHCTHIHLNLANVPCKRLAHIPLHADHITPISTCALPTMHTFMCTCLTKRTYPSAPTLRAGAMGIGVDPFARSATALQGSIATVLAIAWTV